MDYIFKLVKDFDNGQEFRICVESKTNCFNLIVLQDSNSWTAEVKPKHLEYLGQQFDMTSTQYFLSVQDYLAYSSTNVKFKITENEFSIYCLTGENIKVKYFYCNLEKVDYNKTVYDLLDKFYLNGTEISKTLDQTNREKNELANGKELLEEKLKEYVECKKSDDQEIYNSFVMVLNEKKRRISHLNELVEAFRSGRPRINPHIDVKKRNPKKTVSNIHTIPKEEVSESSSENSTKEDYHTDEEIFSKHLEEEKSNEKMIITSKSTHDLLDDIPSYRSLPKRTRRTETVNYNSLPSTSTVISSTKNKDGETSIADENLCLTELISTQELLDHI